MIADVLSVYGTDVAPHRQSAKHIGYCIGSLLNWWGSKTAADISTKTCRQYAATKTGPAASGDLKVLKAAVNYWHKEYGPLNFIPTFWRPADHTPRERWLTRSEAARLLWAARRYLHMRRMILLGLYTGSRPGVILALQWDQIDFRSGMMSRLRPGQVESKKKRAPKVRLGRRILTHLRRWKRLDAGERFVCHFEGRAVDDPHASWRKIVKASGLAGVTRHTLRHTRATWLMQRGVPVWEAAGHLGMTVRTLEAVYGHHSPDHQERAANV